MSEFPLHRLGCRRIVRGIRENPTPAEGVAARYENKETALWNSRKAGCANGSARDSEKTKDPPSESRPGQAKARQAQDHKDAQAAREGQDQGASQGQESKKAGDSETQGESFIHPSRSRTAGDAGGRSPGVRGRSSPIRAGRRPFRPGGRAARGEDGANQIRPEDSADSPGRRRTRRAAHDRPGSEVCPGSDGSAGQPEREEAALPEAYGTGKLLLAARDPHWLYAHWDLTPEQQRQLQRPFRRPSSRGAGLSPAAIGASPASEVHVHPESRHWFIHVDRADTQYVAELGYYRPGRQWVTIATSAPGSDAGGHGLDRPDRAVRDHSRATCG